MRTVSSRLAVAVALFSCAASSAHSGDDVKLRLLEHVAAEPLMVMAADDVSLDEVYEHWMEMLGRFGSREGRAEAEANLGAWEREVGCSLRQDLLARIGPEYALVLDMPPVDQLMGAAAGGPQAIGRALTNLGFLALVDGRKGFDDCLRKVLANGEATITEEDGLVRADFGSQPEGEIALYYGFLGDVFAAGSSPEFVKASLQPRPEGRRLADGEDYARVFKHLDPTPTSASYINLPKLATRVKESGFLQAMIEQDPESRKLMDALLEPEFTGTGMGSTSVEVEGGIRTTYFASSALSGGFGGGAATGIVAAIAIPNLLNAIDRGKQKRTMADMRSVAIAIEEYSLDNDVYPGPTEGWVPVVDLSDALTPDYIRQLPSVDGWGHPLRVWSDGEQYRIVSAGKGGELDRDWSGDIGAGGTTSSFTADIVFADGSFVVWPEGKQE